MKIQKIQGISPLFRLIIVTNEMRIFKISHKMIKEDFNIGNNFLKVILKSKYIQQLIDNFSNILYKRTDTERFNHIVHIIVVLKSKILHSNNKKVKR